MMYQKKVLLAEELRRLQDDVWEIEDRVYGTRRYGTQGLYGKYSECFNKVPSSGRSDLPAMEKLSRWSDKEENEQFGFDIDKEHLSSVNEEKLRDRINKFQEYRRVLQEREDQYIDNIKTCERLAKAQKS
jgi:hypothetical protein